jgi:hydroxypyruvate isomerase
MKFSANLSMLFTELPFSQRFAEAASCGFSAVEFWFPFDFGGRELIPVIQAAGVQVVLFNLDPGDTQQGEWGTLGIPDRERHFKQAFEQAVELALQMNCSKLNALAGVRPDSIEFKRCFEIMHQNLEWAAGQLPNGLTLLVEALNPIDKRGYLLPEPEKGLALLKDLDTPAVGLLFDIYHAYRVESDVFRILREDASRIGHIQIADSPERHQPGTGNIPFKRVFKAIQRAKYDGYIGLEYKPLGNTRESLKWLMTWTV